MPRGAATLPAWCKPNQAVQSTGWRATFFYPGGSIYKGRWLKNQTHGYGLLETKGKYIYDGTWLHGMRHGYGTIRQRLPDGTCERIYMGSWHQDKKCGRGKQFYANGNYHGWFLENQRHGPGMMTYNNGNEYLGMWEADVQHGLGVFFYANGNRYEGNFARGYKNGEGTFYHMHTGQIQKGMWENDICKTSLMVDDFRNQVVYPTEYPIPKMGLAEPDVFVRHVFKKYMDNKNKPTKSMMEQICLSAIHKWRNFANLEPRAILLESRVPIGDIHLPCTCKKREKIIILRQRE